MKSPTKAWDRPAILAEVHRQGMTLTGIAIDAGLHSTTCRKGIIGASRPGAEAIARAIGVPFRELFPDSYSRGRHDEGRNSRNDRSVEGQKTGAGLDAATLVA